MDVQTLHMLQGVADREQRPPEAIASQILEGALRHQEVQEENWACWQRLTPREQEIAALICLYYTTRQIASRLHISPETVKTHAERVLTKFEAADRSALRELLESWDFSAWDR
jgi:DNA-binding NarL/FixJ family response regulator